ncbi:Rpn family recombination-promoting nuclease/putative transposase [uncultured Thiodictyon sp.]|uniref:Rpn family recombination-promoting nuclease/putative transposase n=1 Tax=uncultured Thiodictyon sp. TaxID=1846217 RepID=UPI0034518CE1
MGYYVSTDLRSVYSDLVYRLRYGDGRLNLYLLFEHKSSPEHWTLLQLLRYISRVGCTLAVGVGPIRAAVHLRPARHLCPHRRLLHSG